MSKRPCEGAAGHPKRSRAETSTACSFSAALPPSEIAVDGRGRRWQQEHVSFLSFDSRFHSLFPGGTFPTVAEPLATHPSFNAFHEAAVYLPEQDEVFCVSNRLQKVPMDRPMEDGKEEEAASEDAGASAGPEQHVRLFAVGLKTGVVREIEDSGVIMANGAVLSTRTHPKPMLYILSQGLHAAGQEGFFPSSLLVLDPSPGAGAAAMALNNFLGLPFNSMNDVCQSRINNTLFFTDPR